MRDVLTEELFAVRDEQSMRVALAMLRGHLVELKLSEIVIARLMTVSSELANNVVKYATAGTLFLKQVKAGHKLGIEISVVDKGPGIPDAEQAMQDHFSTKGTLGLGLPGVKRMVDDFTLESEAGKGTSVSAIIWL